MPENTGPWRRAMAALGRARTSVGKLRTPASPAWTQTPDVIADVSEWRADQQELAADVVWSGDAERAVIERLLTDVRATEDDERGPVRLLSCWLSVDDTTQAVQVHVGDYVVGTLGAAATPTARTVIGHRGGVRREVGSFAHLHGDGVDTATLTVFLPDRP